MKKIAIVGYGNLGKACEKIALGWDDAKIVGIFSRRNDVASPYGTPVFPQRDIFDAVGQADVAVLCTGSANDLMGLGEALAGKLNTVDSFDTHAKIVGYVKRMDALAREGGTLSFVGIGWDPGIFSLCRALFEAALPDGYTHTFWGKGVSQGHSEAIRRLDGVADAVQYTLPKQDAIDLALRGEGRELTERDKHLRVCYVALKEGADRERVAQQIKNMPNYFAPYDVEINFTDINTLKSEHGGMPHGGQVLRSGASNGKKCNMSLKLQLESNPDFTAGVLMRYAAACARLNAGGESGARTIVDIPVAALFENGDALRFI